MTQASTSQFLRCMVATIGFIVCIAACAVGSASAKQPNILFIITDQHQAEMLSCTGNRYLSTPALDSLANTGIRFTHAYVTNPVCVPSRISLATGVMPGRFGVFQNGMHAVVPPEVNENSLGKLMKQGGYDTFYGGKVHMCPELNPLNAGYDVYFRDEREALPRACIEFIERKRDKPFFAVTSFINPHDICYAYGAYKGQLSKKMEHVEHLYQQAAAMPLDQLPPLPENFEVPNGEPDAIDIFSDPESVTPSGIMRNVYDEREWRIYRWIYCRLTEQVDRHIASILDALKRNALEDETLVIFTSDHGDMNGCHRLASKGRFYEQSVKVPLLIKYPGNILPGVVDGTHLVSTGLDILPTLCDYAGQSIPKALLGRSLRPIAEGKPVSDWRGYVVTENQTGRMIRSPRFKYCVYSQGERRESLVDLERDPGEMNNIASLPESQPVLLEHRRMLQQWIDESNDVAAKAFADVQAVRTGTNSLP